MQFRYKSHYFTGLKHCGSQKVFMIEGQGVNSPAFTTYKAAYNYRKIHELQSHQIFSVRYTIIAEMRLNRN